MKEERSIARWLTNWGWILLYTVLMSGAVWFIMQEDSGQIEDNSPEKITLTFRHFWIKEHDRPLLAIFEEVVKNYQVSHPNVKVNFEGLDQTIHREQKLKSEMVTGTPPDMFVLFGGAEIEPYVRSNRLMDLTDFTEVNGLGDQFKDLHLWTFNKRIYGLPIEGNAEPLYYNKSIFAELGLDIPVTVAELDRVITKLKAAGYIPFALGNEDLWPAGVFAHYLMDRYAGPELIQKLVTGEDGASFQNSSYSDAFRHLDKWIDEGAFSGDSNNVSTENAVGLFTEGKQPCILTETGTSICSQARQRRQISEPGWCNSVSRADQGGRDVDRRRLHYRNRTLFEPQRSEAGSCPGTDESFLYEGDSDPDSIRRTENSVDAHCLRPG